MRTQFIYDILLLKIVVICSIEVLLFIENYYPVTNDRIYQFKFVNFELYN